MNIREINKTILDVSFKHGLSHLSSCLTAAPIIKEIYETKKPEEKFVLSSGHAGLALYAIIEQNTGESHESGSQSQSIGGISDGAGYPYRTANEIFLHHGIHPDRCADCHLDCSTGSLGQGLPIALGLALGNPAHNVYCLISDGECAEGSIWEALRIKTEQGADNLKVYANLNGHTAYRDSPSFDLARRLEAFDSKIKVVFTTNPALPWLTGVAGHYAVMDEAKYKEALELLT